MTGKYYHLFLRRPTGVSRDDVEHVLNRALDWYRLSDELWIIYSTSSIDHWKERLSRFMVPDGYVFLCELNAKRRIGWMPKSFWKWLSKPRDSD